MTKILFGPAGLGSPAIEGLKLIKSLGLDAAEISFTHGVNFSAEKSKEVGEFAKKLGISLSIHAPYYINLASEEKSKREASKKRIFDSCKSGHYLGAKYIVFHPAYYGKLEKEDVYDIVRDSIIEIQDALKDENYEDVSLCPEITGKKTQFGDVDELVKLSRETNCGVCIDFAHIYARNIGFIDYDYVCREIKKIKVLTGHFAGIEFTDKGERRHILTEPGRARELLTYLKKYKISVRIINESPDPVRDALMMKKIWNRI